MEVKKTVLEMSIDDAKCIDDYVQSYNSPTTGKITRSFLYTYAINQIAERIKKTGTHTNLKGE